tara:strand:- start:2294 stop:3145 length:852 start_codon:yes stop_codon:yes gene_type:complete
MKTLFIFFNTLFVLHFGVVNAKDHSSGAAFVLDTIYANDYANVALFFPKPIRQGITGSEHFIFTFNRERGQPLGLLQAKPGTESNLLVITTDGLIYSYIIKYKSELTRLNYFVKPEASIGNELQSRELLTPIAVDPVPEVRLSRFERISAKLLQRKQRLGHLKQRRYGMLLSVKNIVFKDEELYFVMELETKSGLDYDVNFLNITVESRSKGKRKSSQRVLKKPKLTYQLPEKIKKGEQAHFVYVLPKFSLSSDQRILVQLNEKNGERNLELKISHRFINNPN